MNSRRPWPVVAGVDFSPRSDLAVEYAACEAERRGLDLRLVHGLVIPIPPLTPFPALYDDQEVRARAEKELDEFAAAVQRQHPRLVIATRLASLVGGITLIEESATASVLVVGARERGGFTHLLVGSVAGQITTYANCPVIVVAGPARDPAGTQDPGSVVVGVDASWRAGRTLEFALEEAAQRGSRLVAVHVWARAGRGGPHGGTWPHGPEENDEGAHRLLANALAGWQEDFPDVEVEHRTVLSDRPAHALLDVCNQAAAGLVVVGSRGRGGFTGPLLGSVSQSLVAHAALPVAVVHPLTGFQALEVLDGT